MASGLSLISWIENPLFTSPVCLVCAPRSVESTCTWMPQSVALVRLHSAGGWQSTTELEVHSTVGPHSIGGLLLLSDWTISTRTSTSTTVSLGNVKSWDESWCEVDSDVDVDALGSGSWFAVQGKMDGTTPSFRGRTFWVLGLAEYIAVRVSLKSSGLKCAWQTLEDSVGFHKIITFAFSDDFSDDFLTAIRHLTLSSGSFGKRYPPRLSQPGTTHLYGMMLMIWSWTPVSKFARWIWYTSVRLFCRQWQVLFFSFISCPTQPVSGNVTTCRFVTPCLRINAPSCLICVTHGPFYWFFDSRFLNRWHSNVSRHARPRARKCCGRSPGSAADGFFRTRKCNGRVLSSTGPGSTGFSTKVLPF